MRKTVYLHIGAHKTGTSYLQALMEHNREILAQLGYLYIGKITRSINVAGDSVKDTLTSSLPFFLKSDLQACIISDEDLCHNTNGLCEEIISSLQKYFEVKVIYYLREITSYYLSFYKYASVWLCNTSQVPHVNNIIEYAKRQNAYCNAFKLLEILSARIPKENLIVRRYNKPDFLNGTLMTDFFSVVGVDHTKLTQHKTVANVSPTLWQAEQLYYVLRLTQQPNIRRQAQDYLLNSLPRPLDNLMISHDEASYLRQQFGPMQKIIEQKYVALAKSSKSFDEELDDWENKIKNSNSKRFLSVEHRREVSDLVSMLGEASI